MITPGLEEIRNQFNSRYDLVILASERAKQLQQGASPLVRTTAHHPLTIALEEIAAGAYPPVAKEGPKELDEEFISGALADQGLNDITDRFETLQTLAPVDEAAGTEGGEDENEDEEG